MKNTDPLLDSIQARLDRQARRDSGRTKTQSESRLERMREDGRAFHRFAYQVAVGALWVWQKLGPLRSFLSWATRGVFRQYRRLWSLVVYRRDQHQNLRLSKTRAGLFLAGTALSLWLIWEIVGFLFDATLYLTTGHHNEIIYLTNSQEVDARHNVHAVKGCDALPCSDTDSVYFRMNPSAFNHVWSLAHNHMLFYPDFVGAAVPPGLNRCTITSYGVRVKFLMRGFDIYPELLKASCTPVAKVESSSGPSP